MLGARPLAAAVGIVVVMVAAGCSSSPIGADKAAVAADRRAITRDQAALVRDRPTYVVLCAATSSCAVSTTTPSTTDTRSRDEQRLAVDDVRLKEALSTLLKDERQ